MKGVFNFVDNNKFIRKLMFIEILVTILEFASLAQKQKFVEEFLLKWLSFHITDLAILG